MFPSTPEKAPKRPSGSLSEDQVEDSVLGATSQTCATEIPCAGNAAGVQKRFATPAALAETFHSKGGTCAYTEVSNLADEAVRTSVRSALSEALRVARKESAEPCERPVRRRRLSKSSCSAESSSSSASASSGSRGSVDAWLPAALSAALPLLSGSLPRDQRGLCVIPHPHELKQERACRRDLFLTETGNVAYQTRRACDNCDRPIQGRVWYSCTAEGCEVDFCLRCHKSLTELFAGRNMDNARWSAEFTGQVSTLILSMLSREEREELIRVLAFEWPVTMFEQLVQAVADVADAKVVHVQDGADCDLTLDAEFWHIIGFLQLLHASNLLPGREMRFGELCLRGPRIPLERFVLGAIDKCDAEADLKRWKKNCSADTSLPGRMVLEESSFCVSKEFAVFLAHGALVPIGFRQRCLQHDVNDAVFGELRRRRSALKLRVPREPAALCEAVVNALGAENAELTKKLAVSFQGEQGEGPGVVREFLCLAMKSLLDGCPSGAAAGPWEYDAQLRTYWFREPLVEWREGLRACGALIGHALLTGSFLQASLPQAIYAHLLRSLGSTQPSEPRLADLALVRPELAKGLQQLIEFDGDNVADVFPLDWPGASRLDHPDTDRKDYVSDYVKWFFFERFESHLSALADGFKAVLGRSRLLRSLIDATQFEQILCGAEAPLDVEALRRGAEVKGWSADDSGYLDGFWEILKGFNSAEQRRFIVFVSSCARMPPQGWQDLSLQVQKHGTSDARLPTAYTCFTLLLLPRYTSADILRVRLHAAIMETEGFGLS